MERLSKTQPTRDSCALIGNGKKSIQGCTKATFAGKNLPSAPNWEQLDHTMTRMLLNQLVVLGRGIFLGVESGWPNPLRPSRAGSSLGTSAFIVAFFL